MKRFYKEALVVSADSGHSIALDGRAVLTPARVLLEVPSHALAQAIADEWNAQGDKVDPASMVMTGLSNAAIDQVAPDPASFGAGIAAYGESDLLCYRAGTPPSLVAQQQREWNPLLDWAEQQFGIRFVLATGILHTPQPEATVRALADAVAACDAFTLTGLSTLVSMSGSLVCGLAVIAEAFPLDQIWAAAELDTLWQAQQWGEDEEASARHALRTAEFATAARFIALARA
jgi:chaperone required for assembly of F1-ATPase